MKRSSDRETLTRVPPPFPPDTQTRAMPTLAVRASAGAAPRRAAAKASKAPVRAARDVRVRDGDA